MVVAIFGAGLGWGVHQVTLTILNRQMGKLEVRVDRIEADFHKLGLAMGRIENKLDILLRNFPYTAGGSHECRE